MLWDLGRFQYPTLVHVSDTVKLTVEYASPSWHQSGNRNRDKGKGL